MNTTSIDVWLDDEREPPEGFMWVRHPHALNELFCQYHVGILSLDNDLGDGVPIGRTVLDDIEAGALPKPREVHIHTQNPVERQRMLTIALRLNLPVVVWPAGANTSILRYIP